MTDNDSLWAAELAQVDMNLPEKALDLIRHHVALVAEANHTCSLVSHGDLANLWGRHVVDSLSLVPVIQRAGPANGLLLDIGSGGGFPVIPLRIALPELRVVLVERSERKVGFLRRVVAALQLDHVEIVLGEFPHAVQGIVPDWITARAVERPERVVRQILEVLPARAAYLCQSGLGAVWVQEGFHVEPVRDEWSALGLRRGRLEVIQRSA